MSAPESLHPVDPRRTGTSVEFPARRTRAIVAVWRVNLALARVLGIAGRWLFTDFRAVLLVGAAAPAVIFAIRGHWETATIAGGSWLLVLLFIAALSTRNRLIIGDFKSAVAGTEITGLSGTVEVNLGDLLLVEVSRLADLFRVVGDQRAVSSGLSHERSLDATLTVDDLVQNLQGAVSADAKATVGPITIPLAPVVTLVGILLQAPKLTGNLHRDGDMLILTAQASRPRSLSWRVEALASPASAAEDKATSIVSGMVEEIALRIYTDLVLGRAVRWQATRSFVDGLQGFRACLRTPKDRKVNLKRAETHFLDTLAEDEDFPLLYYNLGVVYTELHGLAIAAGRESEAEARLSAAETSFGRAIEKNPDRWESYFGFAQTQFRYSRYGSAIELCGHVIGHLRPGRGGRAKAHELSARALVARRGPGDYRASLQHARTASRLALRSFAQARLIHQSARQGGEDAVSRCAELSAGCVLTFSDIYSRQMPSVDDLAPGGLRRWRQGQIERRVRSLASLAPITRGRAELRFDFGRRLLDGGHFELAERELAAAVRSDPTRPSYSAALALARAMHFSNDDREMALWERDQIIPLCHRAIQAMAGAFFPSRDTLACQMLADVYKCLGSTLHGDHETAEQLERVTEDVERRLKDFDGEASVSGIFLEALQDAGISLSSRVGAYGEAAQAARARLSAGRQFSRDKQYAEALREFRSALEAAERATALNPLSTLAWDSLGDIHRELSDFQNAEIAWSHALATDPDNPYLYGKIGSSYWHIAFQGRAATSVEHLTKAAQQFDDALLLFGSGHFDERTLTHYRLGKLHSALRNFGEARRHLEVVEAVQPIPPIVGWEQLGFAYLQERNFAECEYYFGRAVKEGARLATSHSSDEIVGDRLDEEEWPLALVRTWCHLGLAITYAERDGNLAKADLHVDQAEILLAALELDPLDPSNDERFPTRAPAATLECRGLIRLRQGNIVEATKMLERAVSEYPHSRAYYELALALEQRAIGEVEARKDIVPRARRLLAHAVSLGPSESPSDEIQEALDRLSRLGEGHAR
jgi:tetratricopeptide (TPR) repeat protein